MTERPILFSAPMVRAIIDGTKTQTRRVLRYDPSNFGTLAVEYSDTGHSGPCAYLYEQEYPEEGSLHVACPYGVPGDRLWVREAFAPCAIYGAPVRIDAASYAVLADGTQVYRDPRQVFAGLAKYSPGAFDHIKWRPSIHMPRWASRITLEVTSVRVERLHEITEEDARAEGVRAEPSSLLAASPIGLSAIEAFAELWSSINGPESWAANPWVWVVGFKRVTP